MSTRQKTKNILWIIFLSWLSCEPLWAMIDIARITMGRVTYPKNSLSLDYFNTYQIPNAHDPAKDTLQHEMELEWGYKDNLTLVLGMKSRNATRDSFAADRLIVEGIYRVIQAPFQLAPFVEFLPSLRGDPFKFEFGFQALKSRGYWSPFLFYAGKVEKEGGEYKIENNIGSALFYRFGLNGLAGAEWEYKTDGAHSLNLILGGRVSKNIFLAVEPQFGVSPQAPAFKLVTLINFYFGSYHAGGLE